MKRTSPDGNIPSRRSWARHITAYIFAVLVTGVVVSPSPAAHNAAGQGRVNQPNCSQIDAASLQTEVNFHAFEILKACGLATGGGGLAPASNIGKKQLGGANVDTITGAEALPHVTQSEDQIWANGTTVVVNYNDSIASASGQYSGVSVSTDGGATFTRLLPSPFATGHGNNFGDPIVVYDKKLARWFAGDLAGGCGGQGIGLWTSNNGTGWAATSCAHIGADDDRESMTVDNNTASPFYGRMYISYADYTIGGGALFVTFSDNGSVWSVPTQVNPTFIRDVQTNVTTNGTVLVMAMNEGGGGFNPRQNFVYRSTNGGATFGAAIAMGAPFAAPGDFTSGYFAVVNPIWRYMGWGDLATGSNNVVVYDYTVHGAGGDGGDIYYVRSTDNGATWSAPVRTDGDATGGEQWMPSIAGSGSNFLMSWYDRRHSTNGTNYERWGVISTDGGLHWSTPQRISDALIPQPAQPDPNVVTQYAGDYMRDYFDGTTFYDGWTDGRVAVSGTFQQDVEVQTLTAAAPGPDYVLQQDGSTVGIVPGVNDIGNHCDDCTTSVVFPFPVMLYGVPYPSANVSSNGNLQFETNSGTFSNSSFPTTALGATIAPYWDDLTTTTAGDGVFTAVTGAAPDRTFYIEWRAHTFTGANAVNFEIAFYESSSTFRITYGNVADPGTSATVGVQGSPTGPATQFEFNSGGLSAGLRHEYLIPTAPSGAGGTHILITYADGGGTGSVAAPPTLVAPKTIPSSLRNDLLALGGVASVDIFDAGAGTPSLDLLAGYQVVIPFSNFPYADPTALGNVLGDYELSDQGVVVALNFDWFAGNQTIGGRWLSGGYSPFNPATATDFSNASLGAFSATSPLMAGVASLNAFYREVITLAAGASSVATWSDGQPLIATKINSVNTPTVGRRSVAINAYLGNAALNYSGDFARVIMNAAHWLSPYVDTVAPLNAQIKTPLASAVFQTDKKFTLSWTATDQGSGIASYDVQYKVAPYNAGSGPITPLVLGTASTSMVFVGTPGTTVCFEVRARDQAGNVSAYSPFRCTAVPLDDPALTHAGAWGTVSNGYYYGGTASISTTAGDSLTLTGVQAKQVGVLVTKAPGEGVIQVFMGGVLEGTFNLASGGTSYRQIVSFSLPALTTGTLQIVQASNGLPVEIDGVAMSRN